MAKPRILIVEDDPVMCTVLVTSLEKLGYEVCAKTTTGEEAIERARETTPDLALMDIRLKGRMDGIEAAARLRDLFDVPAIYVTAHDEESLIQRAKATEPLGYLLKPFGVAEIRRTLEMALHREKAERELKRKEELFRAITENSAEATIVLNRDLNYTYISPAVGRILQYSSDEISRKAISELVHPDDLP
jgi:CheY-like chemotaxis protein